MTLRYRMFQWAVLRQQATFCSAIQPSVIYAVPDGKEGSEEERVAKPSTESPSRATQLGMYSNFLPKENVSIVTGHNQEAKAATLSKYLNE